MRIFCCANLASSLARLFRAGSVRSPPEPVTSLLDNLRNSTSANGPAAFTYCETQALFHCDGGDQFHTFFKLDITCDIRGAEVELRPVSREERRVTTALLLAEHVYLGLELRMRSDSTRGRHYLTALDILAFDATQ